MNEQEIKELKSIRNYFGIHDRTPFQHRAYIVIDGLIKKYSKKPEKWKPCGEGDNICNCKKQSQCGYIEFYKQIAKLQVHKS